MAEGLSESTSGETAMRPLALFLVSILPFAGATAARADIPSHITTANPPVRVSLVNLSGEHRAVRVKSGLLDLPCGLLVNVESPIGATLLVVSDTNQSLHEQIVVKPGDDRRIVAIQ